MPRLRQAAATMTGPARAASSPSLAEIGRVAALEPPVLRNLLITQRYHELSSALAARTSPGANWCTFATWASKQAGQTIRREDLARAVADRLAQGPATATLAECAAALLARLGRSRAPAELHDCVFAALRPSAAFDRAAAAVARGNLKVFAEIAREFARFHDECLAGDGSRPEALARFLDGLRPGEPPAGQDRLRAAFTAYHRALSEPGTPARRELLLLANLEIGFHEQTRLQPEIREALDAAWIDRRAFRRRLVLELFPRRGAALLALATTAMPFGTFAALDRAAERLLDDARQKLRETLTDNLMSLALPGGTVLRLGRDLGASFPPELAHLGNPDLLALLARVDATPDSVRSSGATDWADLGERLHFIADFFRCYQQEPRLLGPPFTPAQAAALEDGRVPEGPL
ncbi:MAG: hypothetical protein KBD01_16990 [Acidobacteria bacterium]|nr:hypothetical protein [Acidobacteriota bacterium]